MNNPSQKEKEMLERFDKIFMIYSTNKPIAFMRENPPFNERIIEHPKNIKSFLLSEIRSAVEASEGEIAGWVANKMNADYPKGVHEETHGQWDCGYNAALSDFIQVITSKK